MNAAAYLSRLRQKNEEINASSSNWINPVKDFTQFMQFAFSATKADSSGVTSPVEDSFVDKASARRWWLLHRLDCVPIEVAFDPAVTQAEIFERNRDVIKADQLVHQTPPMSAEGEMAIREWLALIGETDQGATIGFLGLADAAAEQWVVDQLEKMR